MRMRVDDGGDEARVDDGGDEARVDDGGYQKTVAGRRMGRRRKWRASLRRWRCCSARSSKAGASDGRMVRIKAAAMKVEKKV